MTTAVVRRRPVRVGALPGRLQALEEARNVLASEEQERCGDQFRVFMDQLARRGADLSERETHLLWLGWLQSRQAERLYQRVQTAREGRA